MQETQIQLKKSDISLHDLSMMDPRGRLFFHNQKLYRAITKKYTPLYQRLFEEGIISKLIEQEILIDTKITDLKLSGYELVLEHRTIPFISYPHEWCDLMFKDATLLHIDLLIELNEYSLTISDAGSLNILFDGARPVFVDFCSIVPVEEKPRWPGTTYDRFEYTFIHPLNIMSRNYGRLARSFLQDTYYVSTNQLRRELGAFNNGSDLKSRLSIWKNQVFQYFRRNTPLIIRPLVKKQFLFLQEKSVVKDKSFRSNLFSNLKSNLENIHLPPTKVQYDKCYDNFFAPLKPSPEWTIKQKNIYQILQDYQPKSVLDIDCDRGWYAQLVASCGIKVVAFDHHEACIKQLYLDAQKNEFYILPLVIDITSQTFDFSNEYFYSIYKRLNCDLVFALNICFTIFFDRHINLDKLMNRILNLSQKWVLIDYISKDDLSKFIPREDSCTKDHWMLNHWDSLEEFVIILKTKYNLKVTTFSSYPETRQLILCEKSSKEQL
jgi:SAM-dependent methyltransferase